jgi:hypothetical protein
MPVSFPTKRQERGPSSYVGEITKIEDGVNEQYKAKGSAEGTHGLWVTVEVEGWDDPRRLFYPDLPAMRTDRLIGALEDLGIDLDKVTWDGLVGYKFRWARTTESIEMFIRESGKRENRSVNLEVPVELIEGEQDEPTGRAREPR